MTTVLFVDDEQRVLDALRRSLHAQRGRWRMHFACGAEPALALLAEVPVSVVVTDMRMPGMDGAELLAEVRRLQPAAARIVLSGHSELDAALRTAGVAHRFLDKPCDGATLVGVVDGLETPQSLTPAQVELARSRPALPVGPCGAASVDLVLTRRDATARDVAAVVGREPSSAAKLLQLANPAFFGTGAEVHSTDTAVMRLGLTTLRSLRERRVLTEPVSGPTGSTVDAYGRHAAAVTRLAVLLADPTQRPRVHAAALLQHAGRVLLCASGTAVPESSGEADPAVAVGDALLRLWGVPAPVRGLVRATERPPGGEPVDPATGRLTPAHVLRVARLLVAASPLAADIRLHEAGAPGEAELAELLASSALRPWAGDVRWLADEVVAEEAAA